MLNYATTHPEAAMSALARFRSAAAPALRPGDEAHVLAVGLGGGAEPQLERQRPDLVLGHVAEREQRARQRRAGHGVQHVALVLGTVRSTGDPVPAVAFDTAGVMAGRDEVEPQRVGPAQQLVELEVTVALDTRVRGQSGDVVGDVGLDNELLEVVTEVEHVVVDTQLLGDATGIVDVGDRATARVALAAPQLHRDADDIVPLGREEGGGNGAVDATGHGDEHP